jgi:hypothetical protein
MNIEIDNDNGAIYFTEIFHDGGYTYNFTVREGGSITVYGTRPNWGMHAVVFDTLDNEPPKEFAKPILARIVEEANKHESFIKAVRELEIKTK